MSKKRAPRGGIQDTSSISTRQLSKGMIQDLNESAMPDGSYLRARNAMNNSWIGDVTLLTNEPANSFCTKAPYTVIGSIHLYEDHWAIFSTNDVNSEIGWFNENSCEYTTIANDDCLGFKKTNLIIGEAKENFDNTWQVYWADNLNPDRTMNMNKPPWIQDCTIVDDCNICTDTTDLDCEKLRMARLSSMPCISIEAGPSGGEILNGTYQATIAYCVNEQRVTDYSIPSNLLSLFDHRNVNGSIDVVINEIDTTYDEFELVLIGFVNQNLVARRIGVYSTRQHKISIDRIDPASNTTVPISLIPLDRPSYEKSEGIYRNGEYLIRVAPTTRFSFNYQLLANQIKTEWVSVEYPATYYRKQGVNVGYMRDEVYSFFIRWIYTTGDKSESYHIPGRGAFPGETATIPSTVYTTEQFFEANNTATIYPATGTTSDGGTIVAKGLMGYHESSEIYPDNKPEVWGNLCGKNIRHHRMPDNSLDNHFNPINKNIRVLGVQFSNIEYPVDNYGQPIVGIEGYEILRGTREGNKTVVAKGMLNNMGSYIRDDGGGLAYYQNYPYNDLNYDRFLSSSLLSNNTDNIPGGNALGGPSMYSKKNFTFHSPDTQFKHPFLSAKELKIYETVYGTPTGSFVRPYKHPEHKMITNSNFILATLVGFGIAMKSVRGEQKTTAQTAYIDDVGWTLAGYTDGDTNFQTGINAGVIGALNGVITGAAAAESNSGASAFVDMLSGTAGDNSITNGLILNATTSVGSTPGVTSTVYYEWDTFGTTGIPAALRMVQSMPTFVAYWGEGTKSFIDIIKAFSKWHQYATAYQSHCLFDNVDFTHSGERVGIADASYLSDRLQEFGGITVNNLYRGSCVGINTKSDVSPSAIIDGSRVRMSDVSALGSYGNRVKESNFGKSFTTANAAAHYVGIKNRLRNQYGQIDGIIQIPTSSCMQHYIEDVNNPGTTTSDVIFGGDIYIGRYTEKNTFFYFFDWMYDLPNGFEFDYRLRKMMPYPTYWMDTKDFQLNDFFSGLIGLFSSSSSSSPLPSGFQNFDIENILGVGNGLLANGWSLDLIVKDAVMYLFNSGVRDFYVESEVNVEYRDWGDTEDERHYDPYIHTSLIDLFRTDRIKSGNFFKYDYSLSASKYYQTFPSWASVQPRDYDPIVAETAYSYYPKRLIYSLPQSKELKSDNWLLYLIDNYRDFTSRITSVKSIAKNGALIMFETDSPIQFMGVDTLETDGGTKLTIGDGGLFSQALQNLVNSDSSYEYGSCQNRLSVINTPAGLFWISQNQGKIFCYTGQLEDISQIGLKWWFEAFLPYKLTEDFPNFTLLDNPVIGIGCQSIYDNSNSLIYFTKKDYKLKEEWIGEVIYERDNIFSYKKAEVILGDPRYFYDASWTISYDPKSKSWVSFHDWHPDLVLPSRNYFLTIKNASFWKHNIRTDLYCNFYGINYPFEVEITNTTGQTVNTLKSIEYLMEVYVWDKEGVDKHHALDFNFDKAIVYNTEQISGELNLVLSPKNNAPLITTYPRVTSNGIDILYSKEEQKYRFNQFWDITDDRGEFSNARRLMWNTYPNGYIKEINPLNINYNKPLHQRKKFRHYVLNFILIRKISGKYNMQVLITNNKNQYSSR